MSCTCLPSRDRGFVLVVVIGVVMAMAGLVLAFNRRARASVQVADSLCKSAQAACCARAGLGAAVSILRSTAANQGQPAQDRPRDGHWAFELANGTCQMDLADERGKVNLNRLVDAQGHVDRARVDQFLRLIDLINRKDKGEPIGYGIVPALIDWIDADDQRTCLDFIERQNTGAESDYYQGLARPYACANKPLESPEDLLWVKDVTAETYLRLAHYVTVYGDGLINLNVAAQRVIESLSEQLDPALAQVIVERRQARPFQSLDELQQVPGMTDPILQRIRQLATVQSTGEYYQLRSTGQVDRTHRTVSAILHRNTPDGTVDIVTYREDRTQNPEVRGKK
jgi:general secretion pathway protein K